MLTSGTVKNYTWQTTTKIETFFCCLTLVLFSWHASWSSLVMKLDSISQLPSKSTLSLAVLKHMQQCQVGWNNPLSVFAPRCWSKGMAHKKNSPQCLKPRPLSHYSALTNRTTATGLKLEQCLVKTVTCAYIPTLKTLN